MADQPGDRGVGLPGSRLHRAAGGGEPDPPARVGEHERRAVRAVRGDRGDRAERPVLQHLLHRRRQEAHARSTFRPAPGGSSEHQSGPQDMAAEAREHATRPPREPAPERAAHDRARHDRQALARDVRHEVAEPGERGRRRRAPGRRELPLEQAAPEELLGGHHDREREHERGPHADGRGLLVLLDDVPAERRPQAREPDEDARGQVQGEPGDQAPPSANEGSTSAPVHSDRGHQDRRHPHRAQHARASSARRPCRGSRPPTSPRPPRSMPPIITAVRIGSARQEPRLDGDLGGERGDDGQVVEARRGLDG